VTRPRNNLVHRAHAVDFSRRARNFRPHSSTLKLAHRFARAEELAGKIHVDNLLRLRQRHLVNWRVLLQPGVVDDDVNGATLKAVFGL
jgi:hypothetical protein